MHASDIVGLIPGAIVLAVFAGIYFLTSTKRGERVLRCFVAGQMRTLTPAERAEFKDFTLDVRD